MKKLIFLIVLLFAGLALFGQERSLVMQQKLDAVTVYGTGTGYTIFPRILGEYDVSIQMIPALYGVGDSVNYSHVSYLSNSLADNVWTAVSSADTVSSTTDYDALITWTDLKSLRIKVIYTGLSTDTITITPYMVVKKHANE